MPPRRRSVLLAKLSIAEPGGRQPKILDELRRVILSGDAPPNTPVPIDEVAEIFGVSRIPVREALKTLIGEGLVDHRPNLGYTVAQLTSAELHEMYVVREVLETAALATAPIHWAIFLDFDLRNDTGVEHDANCIDPSGFKNMTKGIRNPPRIVGDSDDLAINI